MRRIIHLALIVTVAWTTGCAPPTTSPSQTTTSEGQNAEGPSGVAAAKNNAGLVRFINADPSGAALDILVSDKPLFNGIAFKSIAPYMEVARGVSQFKLHAPGATEDVAVRRLEVFPGRHYTLVALPRGTNNTRLVSLSDSLGLLESKHARVRLINATADVDDLDMFLPGTPGTRLLHGVDSGASTSFTDVEPSMVEIRPRGQAAPANLSNLKIEASRLYTFVVTGTAKALDIVQVVDSFEQQ